MFFSLSVLSWKSTFQKEPIPLRRTVSVLLLCVYVCFCCVSRFKLATKSVCVHVFPALYCLTLYRSVFFFLLVRFQIKPSSTLNVQGSSATFSLGGSLKWRMCITSLIVIAVSKSFFVLLNVDKKITNDVCAVYISIFLFISPVNKQINDKERVAAAMENPNLREIVEQCVTEPDD